MYSLGYSINFLRFAIKTHKQYVTIGNSKNTITLCKKLLKLGYITGFFAVSSTAVVVVLKIFKDVPVAFNFHTYYSAGHKKNYTLYRLKQQLQGLDYSTASVSLLSTSKGLLTEKECLLSTVSGLLVAEIY